MRLYKTTNGKKWHIERSRCSLKLMSVNSISDEKDFDEMTQEEKDNICQICLNPSSPTLFRQSVADHRENARVADRLSRADKRTRNW